MLNWHRWCVRCVPATGPNTLVTTVSLFVGIFVTLVKSQCTFLSRHASITENMSWNYFLWKQMDLFFFPYSHCKSCHSVFWSFSLWSDLRLSPVYLLLPVKLPRPSLYTSFCTQVNISRDGKWVKFNRYRQIIFFKNLYRLGVTRMGHEPTCAPPLDNARDSSAFCPSEGKIAHLRVGFQSVFFLILYIHLCIFFYCLFSFISSNFCYIRVYHSRVWLLIILCYVLSYRGV